MTRDNMIERIFGEHQGTCVSSIVIITVITCGFIPFIGFAWELVQGNVPNATLYALALFAYSCISYWLIRYLLTDNTKRFIKSMIDDIRSTIDNEPRKYRTSTVRNSKNNEIYSNIIAGVPDNQASKEPAHERREQPASQAPKGSAFEDDRMRPPPALDASVGPSPGHPAPHNDTEDATPISTPAPADPSTEAKQTWGAQVLYKPAPRGAHSRRDSTPV